MSESFPLPTEPEGVIPSLLKRFNSGKVEAMMALYAPEAVFVANDGRTITDRAEFTAIFEHDIKLGLPLKANVRHVFVGGDTAQIVLDWSIDGKVLTARSCTCTAQQATSCAAARMGSGGTLSTIIKARRCDSPPDVCAPRQLSAMEPFRLASSRRFWTCAPEFSGETDARLDAKRGTSDQRAHPGGMLQLAFFAAKQDPVAYREGLLGHSPRALAVLLLVAKKAGGDHHFPWGTAAGFRYNSHTEVTRRRSPRSKWRPMALSSQADRLCD